MSVCTSIHICIYVGVNTCINIYMYMIHRDARRVLIEALSLSCDGFSGFGGLSGVGGFGMDLRMGVMAIALWFCYGYIHIYIYMYIYVNREREREREASHGHHPSGFATSVYKCISMYIYIYISIYIHTYIHVYICF